MHRVASTATLSMPALGCPMPEAIGAWKLPVAKALVSRGPWDTFIIVDEGDVASNVRGEIC